MNELEQFLADLAKEAVTEIGPTEKEFLGDAIKAMFKGQTSEAVRLIELVSESIGAKITAKHLHPGA